MDNIARNIETVRRLCAEWTSMTQADFDQVLAPDCEFRNVPIEGDLTVGPAAIGKSLLAMAERWAVAVDIETVVGDERTVMIERTEHFSHRAGRKGPFDLPVVGVFQLADGKITNWKDFFEMSQVRLAG
ncbi:MAG: nuclear transport factor 2 family protein [Acidimicrobiales bacterium]